MGVAAASLPDPAGQSCGRLVRPGNADDVVACPGESLGDVGAETVRYACEQQRAPDRAGHDGQTQRRMLAMMAICASQPAVKVSVRAAGMPAE